MIDGVSNVCDTLFNIVYLHIAKSMIFSPKPISFLLFFFQGTLNILSFSLNSKTLELNKGALSTKFKTNLPSRWYVMPLSCCQTQECTMSYILSVYSHQSSCDKNCTISSQLNCRFFLYKVYDTRDDQLSYEMFFKVLQKNAFRQLQKKIKIYARVSKFKKCSLVTGAQMRMKGYPSVWNDQQHHNCDHLNLESRPLANGRFRQELTKLCRGDGRDQRINLQIAQCGRDSNE